MLQPAGPKRREEDQKLHARVLAGMLKWMPLWQPALLLGLGFVGAMGVRVLWPTDQLKSLEVRVGALEETSAKTQATLQVLADAKCVELTPEQIALAQIDCSRVFGRMQGARDVRRRISQ